MKLHLCLTAALCLATVAFAQNQNQNPGGARPADKPADAAQSTALDGTWTVVSVDKDGKAMADGKDMTVSVKNNTMTCSGKDGKPAMTIKFEYTGPGRAKVMMTEGNAPQKETADKRDGGKDGSKEAVYVLTGDYLAVCVHDDAGTGTGTGTGTGAITTSPVSKSKFSALLKRSGTGTGTGGTGTDR